jgi:hypothetical protein
MAPPPSWRLNLQRLLKGRLTPSVITSLDPLA